MSKRKKHPKISFRVFMSLADSEGFEPSIFDSESKVLPLHHESIKLFRASCFCLSGWSWDGCLCNSLQTRNIRL